MISNQEHFCTLFDSGFLPQGLVLHESLRRHSPSAVLWILCMDDACHDALERLSLPDARLLRLEDLETAEILAARRDRTWGEFCWTMTPQLLAFLLEKRVSDRVTYLDADLRFESDPLELIEEMVEAGKGILITPHDFGDGYGRPEIFGTFCVQFLTAQSDPECLAVVMKWAEQCRKWCFATKDGTGFGDQKYLDAWPVAHPNLVHVLARTHLAHGPWRHSLVPWSKRGMERHVFHHFHKLRILPDGRVRLFHGYWIPPWRQGRAYGDVLKDLREAIGRMDAAGLHWEARPFPWGFGRRLVSRILRAIPLEGWGRL